jgi:hypothetical protein
VCQARGDSTAEACTYKNRAAGFYQAREQAGSCCWCRRSDWGDPAALAAEVSAVKEGIYKRLTEGGVPAFAGQ